MAKNKQINKKTGSMKRTLVDCSEKLPSVEVRTCLVDSLRVDQV